MPPEWLETRVYEALSNFVKLDFEFRDEPDEWKAYRLRHDKWREYDLWFAERLHERHFPYKALRYMEDAIMKGEYLKDIYVNLLAL